MRWSIESRPLAVELPYSKEINGAALTTNCPTLLAYAIAWHESIQGEQNGSWNAATVMSNDGGHGLFQLTSSWPKNWTDPAENALYAMDNYIVPDALYWYRQYQFSGETLVKCVAASFNAGINAAEAGHARGSVDYYTTDSYATRVLELYRTLCATGSPV